MRLLETFYWVPDSPSSDACGGRNPRLKSRSRVARILPTLDHPRSAAHSACTTPGPDVPCAPWLGECSAPGLAPMHALWRLQSVVEGWSRVAGILPTLHHYPIPPHFSPPRSPSAAGQDLAL